MNPNRVAILVVGMDERDYFGYYGMTEALADYTMAVQDCSDVVRLLDGKRRKIKDNLTA
jgi:dipeptide/tripeptide permease